MKIFSETISAGVKRFVKDPLGNAARQEAIAQISKVFNELNGEINNDDFTPILTSIQKGLQNDPLFYKFKDFIINELQNYYFQNWNNSIRSLVALSIIEELSYFKNMMISSYAGWCVTDNFHPDQMITTVFEISQSIKIAISNKLEDAVLMAAINALNPKEVCASLGSGANASTYVHMAITEPDKTSLLTYLLHAGVNPSDVYHIEGISDVVGDSLNSVGKFFRTPIALGKKIASEVYKRGLNLVSLAAYYENVEAMEIVLSANPGIYYQSQLEDALEYQIEINGKYNHGNALTVALMNAESEKSQNIAMQLLRAGSYLNIF